MDFKVKFEFLFVGKEGDTFVRNYFYESDSGEGGKLFVNLGMLGNPVLAEEVSGVVFKSLKEGFLKSGEEAPYERFENALKGINDAVKALQEEKNFKFAANLHIIAGIIFDNTLYLSQCGEAEAYLIRRNHVSVISEGLSDNSSGLDDDEVFTNIASGVLESDDLIIFSSTRLLRYITKNNLAKALSDVPLEVGLEDLKSTIELEVASKVGILAIKTEKEEVKEVSPEKKGLKEKLGVIDIRKVGSLFTRLLDKLSGIYRDIRFRRARTPSVEDKVRDLGTLTRDKILAILVVLIIILGVGIYIIQSKNSQQKYIAELDKVLAEVEEDLETAQTRGNYDRKNASALLARAEEKALEVLNSGHLRAKASSLLDEIQKQKDILDNIVRVSDPKIVVDLSLKRSTVDTLGIVPYRDHFFVYEYNALYEVVLDQVREPLTIDENEIVVSGAYFEDQDAIVFLTKSNRLIEYKDGSFSFMDTADYGWHLGNDIATWDTKVYILDSSSNQIWRYVRRRDGYSNAEGYNLSNTDIKSAVSFVIDASIYVLKKDGTITKFFSGNERTYAVKNSPLIEYEKPVSIYTDKDIYQLFVLDSAQRRVVVYNKDPKSDDLTYSGQYLFENVGDLKDMFYDKKMKRLYVVDNTKVYEIEM